MKVKNLYGNIRDFFRFYAKDNDVEILSDSELTGLLLNNGVPYEDFSDFSLEGMFPKKVSIHYRIHANNFKETRVRVEGTSFYGSD